MNDAYSAGKTALDAKQYDQAVDSLTKATALDEKQVAVWAALADAYVGSAGQKPGPDGEALYQKGFDAFKKAIELAPQRVIHHHELARTYVALGRMEDARKEWEKELTLKPEDNEGENDQKEARAELVKK